MFIQTEQTPNPLTVKFLPECPVLESGTANFQSAQDARTISPLATLLLEIKGVVGVFLSTNFIAVTKDNETEWTDLKPVILGNLIEFLSSDAKIIDTQTPEQTTESNKEYSVDEQAIIDQIKELLNSRVRPAVAQDGGDIIFHEYDDGIVYLTMLGACEGCPSSTATLKMGIENMLKYYIPEVIEVRPVN